MLTLEVLESHPLFIKFNGSADDDMDLEIMLPLGLLISFTCSTIIVIIYNCYAAPATRNSHAGPSSSAMHDSRWIPTGSDDDYFSYEYYYDYFFIVL